MMKKQNQQLKKENRLLKEQLGHSVPSDIFVSKRRGGTIQANESLLNSSGLNMGDLSILENIDTTLTMEESMEV